MADNAELEILAKSKIFNETVTVTKLMELARQLESLPGAPEGRSKWVFIVKGKFIYRDDSEA
jgi:hypothetical protein